MLNVKEVKKSIEDIGLEVKNVNSETNNFSLIFSEDYKFYIVINKEKESILILNDKLNIEYSIFCLHLTKQEILELLIFYLTELI